MNASVTIGTTKITIAVADLGDWGTGELRSEYDPAGPTIRINAKILQSIASRERERFAAHAIAHEMYHHREHVGSEPRIPNRAEREAMAERYARTHFPDFKTIARALVLSAESR